MSHWLILLFLVSCSMLLFLRTSRTSECELDLILSGEESLFVFLDQASFWGSYWSCGLGVPFTICILHRNIPLLKSSDLAMLIYASVTCRIVTVHLAQQSYPLRQFRSFHWCRMQLHGSYLDSGGVIIFYLLHCFTRLFLDSVQGVCFDVWNPSQLQLIYLKDPLFL